MTVQRISTWLKEVVRDCYFYSRLPPPTAVKGHDVRKAATSWADIAGVTPQQICNAATWSSECTFARHYKLNFHDQELSRFSRSTMQLTASSSAERTLRRRLGSTAPYSGR